MKLYFYPFLLLISSFSFSQELDTISKKNYDEELNSLKTRISQLEDLSEKKIQEEKKTNLIDRSKLSFDAVMRLGELDWNQHDMNVKTGERSKPNTRYWSKAQFHLYLDTDITKQFSFRSSIMSHPFYAFGDPSDSKLTIMLNELWVEYKPAKNQFIRFGRQSGSSIWDNNIGELFDWINHDGITYVSKYKLKKDYLFNLKSAFFIEKYADNTPLKKQGKMYGVSADFGKDDKTKSWRLSSGLLMAERIPNVYYSDIANYNYSGDLAPDYSVWTNHFDIKFKQLSNLNFNVNVFYNFKNYKTNPASNLITDKSGNNSFAENNAFVQSETPDFTKQNFGIYANVGVDFSLFKKNFKTSLAYLYMEKYATLDYFAQYDLARWNSTNVKGPEFVVLCQINKWMSLRSRTFFTQEIKGMNGVDPSYRKAGNRTRLDLLINF